MCHLCDIRAAVSLEATSRRRFLGVAGSIAAGLALSSVAFAKDKPPAKPQNVVSPDEALDRLMKGNARYVEGISRRHDFKHEREALVGGQIHRRRPELRRFPHRARIRIGQRPRRLFVCRVAGNFANDDTVASLEYSVAVLNTPMFMVLATKAAARWMRRSSR